MIMESQRIDSAQNDAQIELREDTHEGDSFEAIAMRAEACLGEQNMQDFVINFEQARTNNVDLSNQSGFGALQHLAGNLLDKSIVEAVESASARKLAA